MREHAGLQQWLARARNRAAAVGLGMACALSAGCDRVSGPEATADDGVATRLSRAVALTLADEQIRQAFTAELRASPYSKHRIAFQAYIRSEGGRRFGEAVARHMALSTAQLNDLLAAQPGLEIFLPNAADRDTWTGSDNIVVAASVEKGTAPRFGYDARGATRLLGDFFHSAKQRTEATPASLMIRPTRGLKFRLGRSREVPGNAITMFGEGKIAGSRTVYGAGGDSTFGELMGEGAFIAHGKKTGGALMEMQDGCTDPDAIYCEPYDPGGSGGQTGSTSGIKLYRLIAIGMYDQINDDWAEMRFETYMSNYNQQELAHQSVGLDIPFYTDFLPNVYLMNGWVPSGQGLGPGQYFGYNSIYAVLFVEEDDGGWGRDRVGELYVHSNNNGAFETLPNYFVGDSRCGWAGYDCDYEGYGHIPWSQINMNIRWP